MTESKRKLKSNELWKKEKVESITSKAKAQNMFYFSRSVQKEDTSWLLQAVQSSLTLQMGPSMTSTFKRPPVSSPPGSLLIMNWFPPSTYEVWGAEISKQRHLESVGLQKNSKKNRYLGWWAERWGWRIWKEGNGEMVAGMWLAVSKACQRAGFWEGWQTQDQCTRNGVIRQVTEQTVGQRGGKAALVPKYWVGGDAIVSLQVITHACVLSPYLVSKVVSFIRAGPVVISLRIQHLK